MPDLGVLSFSIAGIGFLLLTALLSVGWEGRAPGRRLIVACAVTSLWALVYAWGAYAGGLPLPLILLLEFLRLGAWLVVLNEVARAMLLGSALVNTVRAAVLLAGLGVFAPLAFPALAASARPLHSLLVYGGMGLALLGLVLLEQIYRNSREQARYAVKFLVIPLGVLFAYDLFVFAQGLLLKGIESDSWHARGIVTALAVPMLALAARRNPQWSLSLNIFVSRQVVFYSATFVAVGIYLLVMAFGGYLIAQFGGHWARTAEMVFVAGAIMVLLTLLASNDLRRRLRVFLAKHFYRNKYDYRVEWLRFIQTLSDEGEGVVPAREASTPMATAPRTIRAIAQIIGSPGGVLFLRDEVTGRHVPAAAWPPGDFKLQKFGTLEATDELVQFLGQRQWVVDVDEHRLTPDLYDHIALPAMFDPPSPFRIVLPLLLGVELMGFLVLAEPPPPFRPTYEDRDLLKTVGRHVATHIAQQEADRKLAEGRQFEAFHRLTAFVMHDLKNLAAQLSLIVANAEKHRRNPEFVDDAIRTVANSAERMQRLIDQLQGRETHGQARRMALGEVVRRAVERCTLRPPAPVVAVVQDAAVNADPERLTSTLEHLVRNAQDATPADGMVEVGVRIDGEQ
ncbi:MAG TPA: XrtA/PEP-CTERM system histidine kinase PrsK, partial [Steroidobacteraceae bacterium]|nr:XrtA/PEP-CTERM system histidine kinase PrsK [Steroidobacteraceae bacterium]